MLTLRVECYNVFQPFELDTVGMVKQKDKQDQKKKICIAKANVTRKVVRCKVFSIGIQPAQYIRKIETGARFVLRMHDLCYFKPYACAEYISFQCT